MEKYFTLREQLDSHIIIHIPHSSLYIPEDMCDDYLLTKDALELDCKKFADMFTDELFGTLFEQHGGIRLDVSRVFLDVERFRDDKDEPMSKIGMGLAYTKTSDLKDLRTLKYKEKILEIYDAYHAALDELVEQKLQRHGKCLIIDCHSFPSVPRAFMLNKNYYEIDVCIGYEEFHKDMKVIKKIQNTFEQIGYKIGINEPYSGSLVSNKHYGKDSRVTSVMIELNRSLYMDDVVTFEKNANYWNVQSILDTLLCKSIKER